MYLLVHTLVLNFADQSEVKIVQDYVVRNKLSASKNYLPTHVHTLHVALTHYQSLSYSCRNLSPRIVCDTSRKHFETTDFEFIKILCFINPSVRVNSQISKILSRKSHTTSLKVLKIICPK